MGCGGQSIGSMYGGASYIGPSTVYSTSANVPLLINLVPIPTDGSSFIPAVFVISFFSSVSSYNLKQGNADIAAAATDFQIDSTIAIGTYWRIDVNTPDQAYLSVLTPDNAVGNGIVITRIDSLGAAGEP